MPFASEWLYKRLGWRYVFAYAAFEVTSALLITAGTLGIFLLYTDVSASQFWNAFVIAELATVAGLVFVIAKARPRVWPLVEWVREGKPAGAAEDAWRRAAGLPRELAVSNGWQP